MIEQGYMVWVSYYDSGDSTVHGFKFTNFDEALKFTYDNYYRSNRDFVLNLDYYAIDGDGNADYDFICALDGPTTLVLGSFGQKGFHFELPSDLNDKKTAIMKEKRIINKQKIDLISRTQPQKFISTYKVNIIDFDNGEKEQQKNKDFVWFTDVITYFREYYDLDPKKYVSYKVYNLPKDGNTEEFICSFEGKSIFKLGFWEINI